MCWSGTSSHIIFCMWNLSGFLCMNQKCPRAQGRSSLCQSHLGVAVLNCAILAVAPTGIFFFFFCLLRSYQALSHQLTCDKDPDIRQTSRPKATETKLPKGLIRRAEGEFLTLQEGPWPWHSVGYRPVKDVKFSFSTSNLTGLSKICSSASALPLCLDG